MMQSVADCAYGGGWLMGMIALLILLLLVVSVAALLTTDGHDRKDRL